MPENQTLGKMEAGFRLEVAEKWTAFIRSDYTFGSGYSNVSVSAGLNYAF